eukprot:GILI01028657.1.p1 GENE.GILI01028657.1~~GILI01028657.1.p1  ORF type:complete len:313 (-),score=83.82 GILI01028657.1:394-1302(-)
MAESSDSQRAFKGRGSQRYRSNRDKQSDDFYSEKRETRRNDPGPARERDWESLRQKRDVTTPPSSSSSSSSSASLPSSSTPSSTPVLSSSNSSNSTLDPHVPSSTSDSDRRWREGKAKAETPRRSNKEEEESLSSSMENMKISQTAPSTSPAPLLPSEDDHETKHVVEIFSIPSSFRPYHVRELLEPVCGPDDFSLTPIDSTSMLAVFRSAALARRALSTVQHDFIKLRPFSHSSEELKSKFSNQLPRAQTTAVVARRLITTHIDAKLTPAQRDEERKFRAEQRKAEKERKEKQKKEDAWDE